MKYFLSHRRISLINYGKITEPNSLESIVPQGSPVLPFLFLIHTSSLFNNIRETGAHIAAFIDDITIYKSGRDIDKGITMLSKLLQICHEWYQDCHTEFDHSNKLGFVHAHKSKSRLQKKNKKIKKMANKAYATKHWLR